MQLAVRTTTDRNQTRVIYAGGQIQPLAGAH